MGNLLKPKGIRIYPQISQNAQKNLKRLPDFKN
jgi:hypothetical protein